MGVPQGSILGPLFFNLYVNDMHESMAYSKLILYADDGIVYIVGKDLRDMCSKLNHDLDNLLEYCSMNSLLINSKKTKSMIFTSCNRPANDLVIRVGNEAIEQVDSFKYLGVWIDSRLSFSKESDSIISKLRRCAGLVYRWIPFFGIKPCIDITNALAISQLSYSHLVLSFLSKTDSESAKKAFNKIGKNIYNCRTADLPNFGWKSFDSLLIKFNLLFTYSILREGHGNQILNKLQARIPKHNTRCTHIFEHPQIHKNIGKKAVSNWMPRLWDRMLLCDPHLDAIHSRHAFRGVMAEIAINDYPADFLSIKNCFFGLTSLSFTFVSCPRFTAFSLCSCFLHVCVYTVSFLLLVHTLCGLFCCRYH